MDANVYCFMSVAGPGAAVSNFYNTLMKARCYWPDKGWHWWFGLCDPSGTKPIINDTQVEADNRPPGESYLLINGRWLDLAWGAKNAAMAINTISSLWTDLTIYFKGFVSNEHSGIRGLWIGGECVVLDRRLKQDDVDYDDNGSPMMKMYRQVSPTAHRPIPLFYECNFKTGDALSTTPDYHAKYFHIDALPGTLPGAH